MLARLSQRLRKYSWMHKQYKKALRWYNEVMESENGRKSLRLLYFGIAGLPVLFSSLHRIPNGHVGVVQNLFGNYRGSLLDESAPHFIIPFFEKVHILRIWPIRKRFLQEFTTKDEKIVEAVVHLRIKAKVYYAQDILSQMGTEFAKGFIEQELSLDTEDIVSQHTFEDLVEESDLSAKIIENLITRAREAACFRRLEILDMTVLFRDPLDAP